VIVSREVAGFSAYLLRHVLDHSTFHRGQVGGMIRALGYKPPAINRMDFVLARP
jgi:uncharacterized damage-inducible protein DinB